MFEIDLEKYHSYACAGGVFYFKGEAYCLEFPVDLDTYRRPYGNSYWDKFEARKIFVDLFFQDNEKNWQSAPKIVEIYFRDHIDELLTSSARCIYTDYGQDDRSRTSYCLDDTGIWKESEKQQEHKIIWNINDESYGKRYMSLRRKYIIPGGRHRFTWPRFLREIVDELKIEDFDKALHMSE